MTAQQAGWGAASSVRTPLPRPGSHRPASGHSDRRDERARWSVPLALGFVGMATISFNTTRVAGWPVSDVVFLAAVGALAVQLLARDTRGLARPNVRRASPAALVGSLVLLTAGTLSSLWAPDPVGSMLVVLRFVWLTLVWSWYVRSMACSRVALGRLVSAYRIAVLISSTAAVLGYLGVLQLNETPDGRQAAFNSHPNHLAGLLAIGLPLFLLDVPARADGDRRHGLIPRLLLSGFVVFALSTTGSMSGLTGAAAGLVTIGAAALVARDGSRRRVRGPLPAMAVVAVVAVALVALVQSGAPVIQRMIGLNEGASGVSRSVAARGELNAYVLDRFDQWLVIGAGLDMRSEVLIDDVGHGSVHNMFLKLLYEAGIWALVGLLLLLTVAVRQGWSLLFATRGTELHALTVALLAALATATTFAQFQPVAYERYFWMPVALLGGLWGLRRAELRQRASHVSSVGGPPNGTAR